MVSFKLSSLTSSAAGIFLALSVLGCAPAAEEDGETSGAALSGRDYEEGTVLRVTANQLNVRSKASASSKIVTVVSKGDRLTVTKTSGRDGWVKITTTDDDEGWVGRTYVTKESSDSDEKDKSKSKDDADTSARDGDTCRASRAQDVVNPFQKALHDTIAFAEGTRDQSNDGYDLLFGGTPFASCGQHPNQCIKFENTCSTAAGRYQFLYGTWNSIAKARGYESFEPENQERGAAYLISTVRKVSIPSDRSLTAAELTNVITKLSYEWASLPPGRYGQPKKSMSELWTIYCSILGC